MHEFSPRGLPAISKPSLEKTAHPEWRVHAVSKRFALMGRNPGCSIKLEASALFPSPPLRSPKASETLSPLRLIPVLFSSEEYIFSSDA
ncbi:MAG: hypothetical protein KF800_02295 [Lysobacter sp.]|nr:hypothetical protein [Lysobacter sp.]